MIIFDLSCPKDHRFEGWFASRAEFDRQREGRFISCPSCNSTEIRLVPSAVHVATGARGDAPRVAATAPADIPPQQPMAILRQLLNALAASSEDVGARFAEEARRIHYEQAPSRSIRGQATPEERESLRDEGIDFIQLPPLPAVEDLS